MIEPMIEPIFVILGILASVAIPRLAATREDAEISAAVANLRTLVSDASAYLAVQGSFGNTVTWKQITSVPLTNPGVVATGATNGNLKVGNVSDCIGVKLVNKVPFGDKITPAHIKFTKKNTPTGTCAQVLNAPPVQAYINSTVLNVKNNSNITNAIAIGSSTKIY